MNCTAERVAGNYLYSGRTLGISEPWDIIQLHPDLSPYWPDICAHYDQIGLPHSKSVIWDVSLRELGRHIGYHPSVFLFVPHEGRFWGEEDWLHCVNYINSKNNFMSLARQLDIGIWCRNLSLCRRERVYRGTG